jgi:hypothetical protein
MNDLHQIPLARMNLDLQAGIGRESVMKLPSTKHSMVLALIATAMLLFHSGTFAIGPAYSGSWYNPLQSGHGFSLEYSVLDDGTPVVLAYWYVYDTEGNPIFLVGQGEPEEGNTVTLEFVAPYGMKFGEFDPDTVVREDGGIGVFTFEDSEAGVFDYEPSQWMVQTYGVSAVSIPVVQLLEVAHPTCDEPPPPDGSYVSDYAGSWTGRMIYDRRSTGICHDADVNLLVADANYANLAGDWEIKSITVIRDTGGQASDSKLIMIMSAGLVGDYFIVFDETIDMNIQFPPIDSYGHAEGYWNESDGDCYGDWTFTKD